MANYRQLKYAQYIYHISKKTKTKVVDQKKKKKDNGSMNPKDFSEFWARKSNRLNDITFG